MEKDTQKKYQVPKELEEYMKKGLTPEMEWVISRFSQMVGDVLTVIDATIPPGNQLLHLKKLLNRSMYDAQNDILRRVPAPYGFGLKEGK